MGTSLVSGPPLRSPMTQGAGTAAADWARWFQSFWSKLSGSAIIAQLIVATSVSSTTDFGPLQAGDKVLVIAAAAGNSHFVTVATDSTLPEAAVVGSLYVVLRPF